MYCTVCAEFLLSLYKGNKRTFAVVVTECSCPHVTQSYGSFATAIDKGVALVGMELCCSDHFSELFHVGWFYVDDV